MTPSYELHILPRTAVIGLGRMGLRHIEAVKRLGLPLCAIADVAENAVADAARIHSIETSSCFSNPEDLVRQAKPEAMVIATTAPSHAELVHLAADAGVKYVICEKPMAVSLRQANSMMDICGARGVKLAVNHQMRFMPQYTKVKALIGTDDLGPLVSVLVAGSNFGLAMNASHYFEMFRYITDSPVKCVQSWFDDGNVPNPRGAQFKDRSGRLLAISEKGPTMYMDFSALAGHGLQVVYICRHGQILVDELAGEMRVTKRQPEDRDLATTRYGMPADISNYQIPPTDTVQPTILLWRALLSDGAFPDESVGLHALSCLVAAHVSNEDGNRPVSLFDQVLDQDRIFPWA